MKLVIAIVQDDLVNRVTRSLMEKKHGVTKLSSTGGFLKTGNTTLLIGAEDEKTDEIIEIIRKECKDEGNIVGEKGASDSYANIFVLNMDEFKKI
ncbi:MAG: hypothetical protein GX329_05460 [Tissierellia bacterium]|nr:hypothetical protein [Tissierellia bacterium]